MFIIMLPKSPFKLFQWEDRPLSWMKTCQVLGFSCLLSCDRQSKPSEVTKHISLPKLKEFWSEILINTSNFIHIETSSPRPQLRQSWHLSGQCLPISGHLLPTWAEVRAVAGAGQFSGEGGFKLSGPAVQLKRRLSFLCPSFPPLDTCILQPHLPCQLLAHPLSILHTLNYSQQPW